MLYFGFVFALEFLLLSLWFCFWFVLWFWIVFTCLGFCFRTRLFWWVLRVVGFLVVCLGIIIFVWCVWFGLGIGWLRRLVFVFVDECLWVLVFSLLFCRFVWFDYIFVGLGLLIYYCLLVGVCLLWECVMMMFGYDMNCVWGCLNIVHLIVLFASLAF